MVVVLFSFCFRGGAPRFLLSFPFRLAFSVVCAQFCGEDGEGVDSPFLSFLLLSPPAHLSILV